MQKSKSWLTTSCFAVFVAATGSVSALEVNIAPGLEFVETAHEGEVVRIQRIQDQNNLISGGFAQTSRKCPPFCIQPMLVAPGVTTVGELEVLDFIKNKLNNGDGILIDARTPDWYVKGTIPGSTNIPFTTFSEETDPLVLGAALRKVGVRRKSGTNVFASVWKNIQSLIGKKSGPASTHWDFSEAKELVLWCNGMWCGQSPRAIHGLLKIGYPAEKLNYYRDGMQAWLILGMTVVVPPEGK